MRSDGTAAGTILLRRTGAAHLTDVGGKLFFLGDDGFHGIAPWVSDGTPAGTFMIKQINPSVNTLSTNDLPESTASFNGAFYFVTDDGVHGQELWSSDGTPAGTSMIADINPGPGSAFDQDPFLTIVDDKLFFVADDGVHGRELWRLNFAPTAADQSYTVTISQNLIVSGPGVLAGASDKDNDPLTATLVTQPAHGRVSLKPDGSFIYVPDPGFQGTDRFTYTAQDPFTFGNLATATISVQLPKAYVNPFESLEGTSGLTPFIFSVRLPSPNTTAGPLSYDVFTSDGTSSGLNAHTVSAKAGVNYIPIVAGDAAHGGTVTFARGAAFATVTVYVIAGSLPVTPATEYATFTVNLSDPLNPTVPLNTDSAHNDGVGTIVAQAGQPPQPADRLMRLPSRVGSMPLQQPHAAAALPEPAVVEYFASLARSESTWQPSIQKKAIARNAASFAKRRHHHAAANHFAILDAAFGEMD